MCLKVKRYKDAFLVNPTKDSHQSPTILEEPVFSLPDEILLLILERIPDATTVERCRQLSRRVRRIVDENRTDFARFALLELDLRQLKAIRGIVWRLRLKFANGKKRLKGISVKGINLSRSRLSVDRQNSHFLLEIL
jgi:hypothetical protein